MWNEKRYHSLDYYLKNKFGEKVYKLTLNAGMTCPNRDGLIGTKGCIFCSEGGSGDFASSPLLSITEQIEDAKERLKGKRTGDKYIAYFQAFTNTYAPLPYLRKIFLEAIEHPDIVALSIATRPDCLGEDVLALLEELNQIKPVWVELGLQTIHEKTAEFIRRGYSLDVFQSAVTALFKADISIIVHVIIGLPFENESDLLETINHVCELPIQGIKLQLLHVLTHTDLADHLDLVPEITEEQYIQTVIQCIEHIPEHIVIHRLTGDGPKDLLISPLWSTNKRSILNNIHKALKDQDSWQGKQL